MKKTKFFAVMSCLFAMTACGEHEHTFGERWHSDNSGHWHMATCGHDDVKGDFGEHTFEVYVDSSGARWNKCTVCGYKVALPASNFKNVTEFENTVEIHTPAQKAYLEYSGEYLTIPQSSYPDGRKKNSNPVQVANEEVEASKTTVTWENKEHSDDVTYSVSISTKNDFSDGFDIVGSNEQSIDLYNLFLGDNYYKVNAIKDGEVAYSSDTYKLTVDSTYPRNLYVGEKMTNCRDMGGRVTESGSVIKQGLLYRTCGNGYNQDGVKVDDEGKDIMLKQLKLKTEIVLHNDDGFNFALDGTTVYKTWMDYKGSTQSKHHFSRNTENVKNVFEILANENNYPVYYHCRIGTDRTGLIAILVNGVLGVSLNNIYQDYLFSNFGKIGEKRKIGDGAADDIINYMNEINALPGSNFQEKVYNALITIGVPAETIEKVKNILLDGAKPNNNNGQIVVGAEKMTLSSDLSLQTEDKSSLVARNNPANCFTLKANGTATFTAQTTGSRTLYMYVGNKEQSTSKKFSTSMKVTVDGTEIPVNTATFKDAGMGNCNNRVNYYFVKVSDTAIDAGSHTIVLTGVANDLILGGVSLL